jgi:hypothetical protein
MNPCNPVIEALGANTMASILHLTHRQAPLGISCERASASRMAATAIGDKQKGLARDTWIPTRPTIR